MKMTQSKNIKQRTVVNELKIHLAAGEKRERNIMTGWSNRRQSALLSIQFSKYLTILEINKIQETSIMAESKYDESFPERAMDFASDGLTDSQIAFIVLQL